MERESWQMDMGGPHLGSLRLGRARHTATPRRSAPKVAERTATGNQRKCQLEPQEPDKHRGISGELYGQEPLHHPILHHQPEPTGRAGQQSPNSTDNTHPSRFRIRRTDNNRRKLFLATTALSIDFRKTQGQISIGLKSAPVLFYSAAASFAHLSCSLLHV